MQRFRLGGASALATQDDQVTPAVGPGRAEAVTQPGDRAGDLDAPDTGRRIRTRQLGPRGHEAGLRRYPDGNGVDPQVNGNRGGRRVLEVEERGLPVAADDQHRPGVARESDPLEPGVD